MIKQIQITLLVLAIGFALLGYYSIPDFMRSEDVKLAEIKSVVINFALTITFLLALLAHRKDGKWNRWVAITTTICIAICIFYSFFDGNFNYFFPVIGISYVGVILFGLGNWIFKVKTR